MRAIIVLLCLLVSSNGQIPCNPNTCKLPNCRCLLDPNAPGNLNPAQIPQIVLVTMDYALTQDFKILYDKLFNIVNPNGCPARGTFFIQDLGTNYAIVKNYYDQGFEIGIQSLTGTPPQNLQDWINNVKGVKSKLVSAGIDEKDILGFRPPQFFEGGDNEFIALGDSGLLYDAGCITSQFDSETLYRWPFTLDSVNNQNLCTIGTSPKMSFPGKWEIIMADLTFNGSKYATAQGCPFILTKKDAFDIHYNNFVEHYEGTRTPFVITIDPSWVLEDFKLEGTVEFMDYIRAAFPDTWIVTAHQALQWIQDPTPLVNISDFTPWKC